MKYILTFLFVSFLLNHGYSIIDYKKNDELYVWSKSGLNLRESPNSKSKIIAKLNLGQKIISLESKSEDSYLKYSDIIKDNIKVFNGDLKSVQLKGKWVKVKFNQIEGFVFDAYLSKLKYVNLIKGQYGLEGFLNSSCKPLNVNEIKDSETGSSTKRTVFENGIFIRQTIGYGFSESKIVIPEFSIEEAIMLVRYFNIDIYRVTQPNNNEISLGFEMGGYQIKTMDNVVIIISKWSC